MKRGYSRFRAYLNGGELDCEYSSRALTRVVISGGGLFARANLNGGKLEEEPSLGGRQNRGLRSRTVLRGSKSMSSVH